MKLTMPLLVMANASMSHAMDGVAWLGFVLKAINGWPTTEVRPLKQMFKAYLFKRISP
eukprot:c36762_g1_i1 orf=88-261(+)